jgi:alkylated DNA nucleotide flippase Atl1
MYTRKTWREKMESPTLPKVVKASGEAAKRFGGRTVLVPHPRDVEAVIRTVRRGRVITIGQIRQYLAGKYQTESTCPLTTGIFIRLAAEAAEEDARAGKNKITPYWRVIKDDGSLNPKFPGGLRAQMERLLDEGQMIDTSRKIPRVMANVGQASKLHRSAVASAIPK